MGKELTYDAKAVKEALRARSTRRGVKVSISTLPAGRRVGDYKRQDQKRKDYHAL